MKIGLIGYGKMGHKIEELALKQGHQIGFKTNNIKELTQQLIQHIDVAIEFSHPDAAFDNISFCLENKIPVVSGTTGWLDKMKAAKTHCTKVNGSFFYASNYSIGVNICFQINSILAKLMNHQQAYDVSITEIHHTQKLDAPSGTAISFANQILEQIDRKSTWINEASKDESKLSIHSERIDHVPGTHEIIYQSPIDTIALKHTAHSRDGFAEGAILAASWLIGKKGYFGMNDLLDYGVV